MLIYILAILLFVLLLNYIPRPYKEGATTGTDENCISIAKENQNSIDTLSANMKKILDLQSKVDSIQTQLNVNTTQLSTLADTVNKLPQ
jgi:hypothetical protein